MEKLYNNILIDEENFPPKTIDDESRSCIEIPYLKRKPQVINIAVGRQLFVDNFLIEDTDLKREEHRPVPYENNPIFKAVTPWEKGEVTHYYEHIRPAASILFSGGMWYDGKIKKHRMWYQAGFHGSIAYAESDDGIHFKRGAYQIYGDTNIIMPRGGVWFDTSAVVLNHYPENEEKAEYVMSLYIRPSQTERTGVNVFTSVDGIHWALQTLTGSKGFSKLNGCGDTTNISYNPFRKKWTYSIKHHEGVLGRKRYYAEGDTLVAARDMENMVFWQRADCLDIKHPEYNCEPQLYVFNTIAYESVMLGAYDIWKGPENDVCMATGKPKITEIHLGFSRDGFHYARQKDRTPFIGCSRDAKKWDNGYVHASNTICQIHGDELWFYYSAFQGDEGMRGATEESNGMYANGGIGFAKLRRDGFASLDGTGYITTEKVEFDGKYLFINATAKTLYAEILDDNGKVVKGFEKENCNPFSGDSCKNNITWKEKKDLSELSGKIIKIKFYQEEGSLYSFWISKKQTGESGGYLAGGEVGKESLCDN